MQLRSHNQATVGLKPLQTYMDQTKPLAWELYYMLKPSLMMEKTNQTQCVQTLLTYKDNAYTTREKKNSYANECLSYDQPLKMAFNNKKYHGLIILVKDFGYIFYFVYILGA